MAKSTGGFTDRIAFFLCIVLIVVMVVPVSAQIWTINPGDSIQTAIDNANNGDTVILNPGIYQQNGITISKSIIIEANIANGGNAANTIIDAQSLNNIFNVSGSDSLTIDNLTLKNGYMANNGGAIYSSGPLTINSSIFTNCSTGIPEIRWGSESTGGAIESSGPISITSSTFNGCSAAHGGAIYSTSSLTITSSTFNGCSANTDGGAIYSSGSLSITLSTFNGCSVYFNGGAIYSTGPLIISLSSFNSCMADSGLTGVSSIGGAIYSTDSLTIISSSFADCSAHLGANHTGSGGAIYSTGLLIITLSTFTDCSANFGGAIEGSGTITSSIFADCSAEWGGAILGGGTITNTTFNDCSAERDGGAIWGGGTIISSTFNKCSAGESGGAISGSGTITSSTFTGCSARESGGAISGGGTITSSTFTGCSAPINGGAIKGGIVNMRFSRIYQDGNDPVVMQDGSNVDYNWWGTNDGPGGTLSGSTVWYVLGATAAPSTISPGGTSTVRANLTYNQIGDFGGVNHLDGIPIAYSVVSGPGSVVPISGNTISGVNTSTFTSNAAGTSTINVTVDGQTVSADVLISAPSTAAEITSFNIPGSTAQVINSAAGTIAITMPYGTDRNALIPTFTLSDGATAKIGSTDQVSGVTVNDFTNPVTYLVTAADGVTTKSWTVTVTVAPNTAAEVTSFSLPGQIGSTTINSGAGTIGVTMPFGTDPSNLISSFTLSDGATAKVGSTAQTSGVTTNNFGSPVTYTVTAANGVTMKNWIVTVTNALNPAAEITAFSLPGQVPGSTIINSAAGTIQVTVPYGTPVTSQIATFTLTPSATAKVGNTAQVSGVTPNNFASPVSYVVTAPDGTTTKTWTVTVLFAPNTAAEITAYSLPGQTGSAIINNAAGTIQVTVPYGTDRSAMVSTFTLSAGAAAKVGSTIQISGSTPNNFNAPVIYTVTAADGTTTKTWTVTVTNAPNPAAEITAYKLNGQVGSTVINSGAGTIQVTLPYGAPVTSLIATFALTPSAIAKVGTITQISGVTPNNFAAPVAYVVTAPDGHTTKTWTVTVLHAPNTAAEITAFSLPGQVGSTVINSVAGTIQVTEPYGASVASLIATFTLSTGAMAKVGSTTQVSGVTSNNFNSPVTYVVTAADGITGKNWKVTVTIAPITNVQTTVKIVPKTINLGSKGYFMAFVTLPQAYKGATIDMSKVSVSGAPAVRMVRLKIFPRTVIFVFRTSDLKNVQPGKKVILTVKGELKNSGKIFIFTGSDTVSVISKPSWQPFDIKDISKLSDDQLFKTYSK